MITLPALVRRIVALDASESTLLVAIDGHGAAGKSTLAAELAAKLEATGHRTAIIHMDDFYLPSALRTDGSGAGGAIGEDFDWRRLRDQVLIPLRRGQAARYRRYDWDTDALGGTGEVPPGGIAIIEGVSTYRQELAALYDYRVWVMCSRRQRRERALARDGAAGWTRWKREWIPGEDRYVREHRPDKTADSVISGAGRTASEDSQPSSDLMERYLGLLGVIAKPPCRNALNELVLAHLCRVPFENISKLHHRRRRGLHGLPDLELFLNGIEEHNFGGTCYANNYYLYQLLVNLGYRATLCGADMSAPDVHLVSTVDLDGHQYLVDVGYGAPFRSALPRDLTTDHEVCSGRDRFVLKPQDAVGNSRLEHWRAGALRHGYLAKPAARDISEFTAVIADSFRAQASFMNEIRLARFFPEGAVFIHNLTITEIRGEAVRVRNLANLDELIQVIADQGGISPRITSGVVHDLALSSSPPGHPQ